MLMIAALVSVVNWYIQLDQAFSKIQVQWQWHRRHADTDSCLTSQLPFFFFTSQTKHSLDALQNTWRNAHSVMSLIHYWEITVFSVLIKTEIKVQRF